MSSPTALTGSTRCGIPASMKHPKLFIALICVGPASTAFASDPPTPPPAVAAESAPASNAPPAATAAPDTAAARAAKAQEEQTMRLRKLGYKPKVRNGATFFCKETQLTGSRLSTTVCSDGDTIERLVITSQDQLSTPRQTTQAPVR
jgi:hypothetical protein